LASVTASKLGDEVLRAEALYHLAWVTLTVGGQYSDHEQLCREALSVYEQAGNVNGRAECTWLLGQIYKSTKRHNECKALFQEALQLAVDAQNTYCQAKCLSTLSEMMLNAGDAKTAETLSQQALKLFRELGHLTNVGMTLVLLGRLAVFRNDRAADIWFDEAEMVLKQAGSYHRAGLALLGKGDCAFARCDYHAAQEVYLKALATFKEAGAIQSNFGAFAQLSVGRTAAYLYEYAEARSWLEKATETLKKISMAAHGNLICDIVYGELALYEEKFGEALTFYQRALPAAESLGYAEEAAHCHMKLGMLELSKGRPQVAMLHFVVAAAKQRQANDVNGLSQTLVRLGECFAATGDKLAALSFFRAAYPVCRKIEALRDLADCLVGLGTVCGDRDQVMEGDTLFEKTGDTKGRERCRVALAGL